MSFFGKGLRAFALSYESESMDAPVVSAIGSNELAKAMYREAKRAGVPIFVSNKIIKSMRDCSVNEQIPEESYPDLAKIFANL